MSRPERPATGSPLSLTTHPRLDAALQQGSEEWLAALRSAGAEGGGRWFAQRAGDRDLRQEAAELVRALLEAADPDAQAEAWVGLGELADELADDLLADTAWEGALAAAREADNPDVIAAATARLAAIAEAHGDPLAAAEFYIDFLNWRRQPGHVSDAEDVETAFDEIVRLANTDGARREAALYEFRQAAYTRLLEAEDDRAVEGDWERDPTPYAGWG